jgi:hypothetical protein
MYPGLGGNPYGDFVQRPNLPATTSAGGGGSGNLLGNFNFAQLKTIVDRMGGIDGIIGTMSKVQKIVGQFQQMAPMLKLLFGSFGGKAATKADLERLSPQPRRRVKKRAGPARKGGRPVAVRRTRR